MAVLHTICETWGVDASACMFLLGQPLVLRDSHVACGRKSMQSCHHLGSIQDRIAQPTVCRASSLAVSVGSRFWEHGLVGANDQSANELLMKAAESGDAAALADALANGADIDFQNERGRTPAMRAAFFGRVACLSLLIDAGADIDVRDADGFSAAMLATFATSGGPFGECLNLLMRAGCSLDGYSSREVDAELERRSLLAELSAPASKAKARARI